MNKILELAKIYKYASIISPNFKDYKHIFEEEFEQLANNLDKLNTDKDYFLALSKLIATLNDGHTQVYAPQSLLDETEYLPFSLICVEGKYYIKGATENLKAGILKEIKTINGQSFSELLYNCFNYTHSVNGYTYWSRIENLLPFFLKKTGNIIEFTGNSILEFDLTNK